MDDEGGFGSVGGRVDEEAIIESNVEAILSVDLLRGIVRGHRVDEDGKVDSHFFFGWEQGKSNLGLLTLAMKSLHDSHGSLCFQVAKVEGLTLEAHLGGILDIRLTVHVADNGCDWGTLIVEVIDKDLVITANLFLFSRGSIDFVSHDGKVDSGDRVWWLPRSPVPRRRFEGDDCSPSKVSLTCFFDLDEVELAELREVLLDVPCRRAEGQIRESGLDRRPTLPLIMSGGARLVS